ncbi:AMP-binding protein [Paenibacillus sinopodophylli]|uniref:AMP-binding protein n=1 Tax=Paenibacillus sinopodophylli TaxID=1837342 RepID=UPI001485E9D4|nr:AMP-binding protein [Paenibacillus sinopodophylli]
MDPMLKVDGNTWSKVQFVSRMRVISELGPCRSPEGHRYAIKLRDPVDILAAVVYFREHHASALLLHGDTPTDEAAAMATSAGCRALLLDAPLQALSLRMPEHEDKVPEPEKIRSTLIRAAEGREPQFEPSLLQFSSGTTGDPKLISRSWSDIAWEALSYNSSLAAAGGEPPLVLVPVSHSYGLITGVLAAWAREDIPHVVHTRNPKAALRHIRDNPDSIVYAVPFLYGLMDSLSKGEVRYRKAISSGAPLTERMLEKLRATSGEVWQQYGCSEIGCISLKAGPERPDEVGRPLAHLHVREERLSEEHSEGTVSSEGTGGELVVRNGMKVVRTGDIGVVTAGGELRVLSRLDDLINVSGQKVMPSEVERAIAGLDGVREVVVYGAAHSVWGETVKAMIVADGKIGAEAVRAECSKLLPGYKVPSAVRLVDEIPRKTSGKISRRWLRKWEEEQ